MGGNKKEEAKVSSTWNNAANNNPINNNNNNTNNYQSGWGQNPNNALSSENRSMIREILDGLHFSIKKDI